MHAEKDHKALGDAALVDLYLSSQSTEYFDLLYRRYADRIYGKCMSMLKDTVAAQDATQEIFVKVLLNLSKFNKDSRLSTWIYSITYNYCIDYLRKMKKSASFFSDNQELQIADQSPEISDAALLEIKVEQLQTVLSNMRDEDRILLLMKYQDQMSIIQIADTLGLTESAVKMRLKRAKAKAKETHQSLFRSEES